MLESPVGALGSSRCGGTGSKDAEGLEQRDGYLAGLRLTTRWLVVFDRRSGLPPIEERTEESAARTPSGRDVIVVLA